MTQPLAEELREAFEEWVSTQPVHVVTARHGNVTERLHNGSYLYTTVDAAWMAWQAASTRAAERAGGVVVLCEGILRQPDDSNGDVIEHRGFNRPDVLIDPHGLFPETMYGHRVRVTVQKIGEHRPS